LGAVLIVIGVVSVALSLFDKVANDTIVTISGILDIIFGLLLIIFPGFFASLLSYFLGAVMVIFGVSQIVNLFIARKTIDVQWLWFVLPFIIAVLGVVVLCNTFKTQETLFAVFGVALIAYAVTEIVATVLIRRAAKDAQAISDQSVAADILREAASDVEEVEAEEVKTE